MVYFFLLILDFQYRMRWIPPSVIKSGLFFPLPFWLLLLFNPRESLQGWLHALNDLQKVLGQVWGYQLLLVLLKGPKFQCSFKQISYTWAKGLWPHWHCCNPSSCTAVALGVFESPAQRLWVPRLVASHPSTHLKKSWSELVHVVISTPHLLLRRELVSC